MSIVEIQEELEYWPDQKIQEEIMRPTGAANGQTYLVVLESERRTKERQAYENQMAQQEQPQMTIAEESAMELGGGITDVDPNLMQNQMQDQMMAQQMPQQMQQQMPQQMPQGQPMAMYGGGAIPSRHQFGQTIDPRLAGEEEDVGNPLFGRGGSLFDYTDPWDYAMAGLMLAPIPGSRAAGAALKGLKLARTAAKTGAVKAGQKITAPILEAAGKRAAQKGVALEGGGTSLPLAEAGKLYLQQRGKQGLQYINPKAAEFRTRTLPIGGAAAFISSRGEGDVEAGNLIDVLTPEQIEQLQAENNRLINLSNEEFAAEFGTVNAEKAAKDAAKAEAIVLQQLEKDRRAGLTEAGRLFETSLENVPEDETYKDYLAALEGMEESRKGQVLMDLGSAIANAGHGGDIAKGIQEAGTKARTEKLAVAKEKAATLSAKRASDIDIAMKITTLNTTLKQQSGKTINELLSVLQLNDTWIEDNFPDRAEAIKESLGKALELALSSLPDTDQ